MVVSCEKQGDDEVQYIRSSYDCVAQEYVSWIETGSVQFPLLETGYGSISIKTKVEGTLSFEVKEKVEEQRVENAPGYYYVRPMLSIRDKEKGQSLLYLSDESEKEEVILGKEITCLVQKNTVIIIGGKLVTISNIKISKGEQISTQDPDFDF